MTLIDRYCFSREEEEFFRNLQDSKARFQGNQILLSDRDEEKGHAHMLEIMKNLKHFIWPYMLLSQV